MKYLCLKRKQKKTLFWGIDFIDDINEIILHYGTMKKDGTMNRGSIKMIENLGDDGLKIMKNKIKQKRNKGYRLKRMGLGPNYSYQLWSERVQSKMK